MQSINNWSINKVNKKPFSSTVKLLNNPHLKGVVFRVGVVTPKNPNSALSTIASVDIYLSKRSAMCSIPGSGYLPNKYNSVLVEGGSANDLPRVRYTLSSGVYDFAPFFGTNSSSSTYSIPSPEGHTSYVSNSVSNLGYV